MKQFDVVAETRRRWSAEERGQILEETRSAPVSVVARKHGIAASLVFRWRRQAGIGSKRRVESSATAFVPVVTLPAVPASADLPAHGKDRGVIEIELGRGRLVRVHGGVDADALRHVLAVLDGR